VLISALKKTVTVSELQGSGGHIEYLFLLSKYRDLFGYRGVCFEFPPFLC